MRIFIGRSPALFLVSKTPVFSLSCRIEPSCVRPLALVILLTFLSLKSLSTKAQLVYGIGPKQNAVAATLGVYGQEPVLALTYAHGFHIKITKWLQDDITLFVDLTDMSNLRFDNDFRFTYGGQGYIFEHHKFKLQFRKTFTVNRYSYQDMRATYLGGELELMPGYYVEKFFIAADFYVGDSFAGYVAQPQDFIHNLTIGWGHPHLLNFRTGINAGRHFSNRMTAYVHVDYFVKPPADKPYVYRWYGFMGVSYLFGKATKQPRTEVK